MKISQKIFSVFVFFILAFSTSCVETVVVGSVATTSIVMREKTVSDTRKDDVIAAKLLTALIGNGLKNPGNMIDFDVNEGRVLLVGIARDVKKANLASELSWKISGVKEVIDEIQLRDDFKSSDVGTGFCDYAITATLETKLLFASQISSVNYQVTTVGRTVYLLGVAANNREMEKVLSIASKVRGVEKVVNHIILVDDHRRNG
jgi:osmotically-inducible protein OsmY